MALPNAVTVLWVSPITSKHIINNNNCITLTPFWVSADGERLVCDAQWRETWRGSWVDAELKRSFRISTLTHETFLDSAVYKENQKLDASHPYWDVYHTFLNWFSADKWVHVLPVHDAALLVPIDADSLLLLKKIGCLKSNHNTLCIPPDLRALQSALDIAITQAGGDAFVKLEHQSVKQDFAPYAISNGQEALKQLLSSRVCVSQLQNARNSQHSILVRRWLPSISRDNEFRVFIESGQVSGISQQHWYQHRPIMEHVWAHMPSLVWEACEKLWLKHIRPHVEYNECCLDVWLYAGDNQWTAHLIEINGFGKWGPAGACLYSWVTDPPRAQVPQIRLCH
jgi:hypothetical protein